MPRLRTMVPFFRNEDRCMNQKFKCGLLELLKCDWMVKNESQISHFFTF